MTLHEVLDLLVGAVSGGAVAATVLYAAWEARAAREQAALLSAQLIADKLQALSRVFIDRPELRPYFWDARPLDEADEATRGRVASVAELMLDAFQVTLTGGGKYAARHREGVHAWIVRSLARSPALREKLRDDREILGPALLRLLAEAEAGPGGAAEAHSIREGVPVRGTKGGERGPLLLRQAVGRSARA